MGGDKHYEVEINEGDFSGGAFERACNGRWADGWRLDQIFVQNGNTVIVWARQ